MVQSADCKPVYNISPRSSVVLLEVARGIVSGEVFHSRMLEFQEEWPLVFLPLALMHAGQLERLMASDLGLIYEWKHQANPGTPAELSPEFLSCNYLNNADSEQVLAWAQALRKGDLPNIHPEEAHV